LRLSGTFENAGKEEVDSFKSKIESMKDALKNNLGPLAGYSTAGTDPPKAGSDRVDITAKKGEEEINISVKYGRTERLGSATQVTTSGSSANIFQSVSKYAGQAEKNNKTWRKIGKDDTQGEGEPEWIKPELETVQKALEKDKDWENALESEAREWLGLPSAVTGTSKSYIIVQFPNVNSVKVTKPTGEGWEIQVKRGVKSGKEEGFSSTYIISVKKGKNTVIDDVLKVELRFTGRKYTQWSKGTGWAVLFPDNTPDATVPAGPPLPEESTSESRQRKPRRSEASTTASVLGVTVPLGRSPDGKPATGDSKSKNKILSKNAKVQGQSWGNAKPLNRVKSINETRDLLEHLFEE